MTVPVSPPIADTRPMSQQQAAIPTDSGTHMASAARSIAPHGTGVGLGRTAWVSQSGIRIGVGHGHLSHDGPLDVGRGHARVSHQFSFPFAA